MGIQSWTIRRKLSPRFLCNETNRIGDAPFDDAAFLGEVTEWTLPNDLGLALAHKPKRALHARAERASAEEAGRLLDRMEVPAEFRDRRAGDLPYGLQRRVEIARALFFVFLVLFALSLVLGLVRVVMCVFASLLSASACTFAKIRRCKSGYSQA